MTNVEEKAVALVTVLVNALIDHPEDAKVLAQPGVIIIEVQPGRVGQVIGKHGHLARSMRSILSAFSMRERQPLALDIVHIGERP
jgi:predicted RNA-binding protein YlqC (UPF0109 family)